MLACLAVHCVCHPRTMSLLGVPEFSAFPHALTSSTLPLTGIRINPLRSGVDRLAADPTPDAATVRRGI